MRAELQRLGVGKIDLAFRAVQDGIVRIETAMASIGSGNGHGSVLARTGIFLQKFAQPPNGDLLDLANAVGKFVEFDLYQPGVGKRLPNSLTPIFFAHRYASIQLLRESQKCISPVARFVEILDRYRPGTGLIQPKKIVRDFADQLRSPPW